MERSTVVSEIRQKADQMAADVMTGAMDAGNIVQLLSALSEIQAKAESAGFAAIPCLIGEMRKALKADLGQPEAFLAAITRLQQAIDEARTDAGLAPAPVLTVSAAAQRLRPILSCWPTSSWSPGIIWRPSRASC